MDIQFDYLFPFKLASSYGLMYSVLSFVITQISTLLPDPKSLNIPPAIASLTNFFPSSTLKTF